MINFTLAEFKAFGKAVARQLKQGAHEQLILMRAARAIEADFKKAEKALRK